MQEKIFLWGKYYFIFISSFPQSEIGQMQKKAKMKKTSSNFKNLFLKIHKDNLLRSPYYEQAPKSILMLPTTKQISFNTNLHSSKMKLVYQKKVSSEDYRPRTARPPCSKVTISLEKQLESQAFRNFSQCMEKVQGQMTAKLREERQYQLPVIIKQLRRLSTLCQQLKQCPYKSQEIFSNFETNLSQNLQHRRTRIIFYLIYAKYLECNSSNENIHRQLKLLSRCDFYGRVLGNYQLALCVCVRMQKILFVVKLWDESRELARKVIRLALYLKNSLEEYKAIEALKMISFYQGRINTCKQNYLTKQDREQIHKNYHPMHDLNSQQSQGIEEAPDIPHRKVYALERVLSEDDVNVSKNVEKFVSNLTLMRKDLTDRSKNIMETIKKVGKVGSVNKYLETGTFITLQPRSRNLPDKNRGQILLTHSRKKSQNESNRKFNKLYLPKLIEMLKIIMEFNKN